MLGYRAPNVEELGSQYQGIGPESCIMNHLESLLDSTLITYTHFYATYCIQCHHFYHSCSTLIVKKNARVECHQHQRYKTLTSFLVPCTQIWTLEVYNAAFAVTYQMILCPIFNHLQQHVVIKMLGCGIYQTLFHIQMAFR